MGGFGGGLFGGGRQISPADIEYLEQVEAAAYELDDRLEAARAQLAAASAGGFEAFAARGDALPDAIGAALAAARRMLAGGDGGR